MNKIRLLGKSELYTDEEIKPSREYGIFLIASRISKEKPDDEDAFIYRLKISHIDSLIDIKEDKKIKTKDGHTPSQKLRYRIIQNLTDDEYESFMGYLMGRLDELCDEYINKLK